MKVLKKAIVAKSNEKIQIEDWSEDYPFLHTFGDLLVAFSKTEAGYSYRAECQFSTKEEAEEAFEKLKNGAACLDDFNFLSRKLGDLIPFRKFRFHY